MAPDSNSFEWIIRLIIVFLNKNMQNFCYESLLVCFLDQQNNSCILWFYFKCFLDDTKQWLPKQVISQVYSTIPILEYGQSYAPLYATLLLFYPMNLVNSNVVSTQEILMAILLQIQHSHLQGYNIRNEVGHNYSTF